MRMPAIRLTKKIVAELPNPDAGQVLYRDTQLRGFGLRVGRRSKSYFAEKQVNRRTMRLTVGDAALMGTEAARAKALSVLVSLADGRREALNEVVGTAPPTLQEAFDGFFTAKPNLSNTTTPNYKRTINLYLKDWSARPISDITRRMVVERHGVIAAQHGGVTANNAMRHLRSVYNYTNATVCELPPNPVSVLGQARAWTRETRRRTVISLRSLPRWYSAVVKEDAQARDFLLMALFTGLRRSELASLQWSYIDLEAQTLTVPKTKNGDAHELPLSKFLLELLKQRREAHKDAAWVFPGSGKTGHLVEMKSFVSRVASASGVKFTLHDLRRTFVTCAESLEIPAYALKRLLNHRTSGDVTAGYIIITVDRLRAPVERISQHLQEKLNDPAT
jgi:integrase